jgi:hypothetical protein
VTTKLSVSETSGAGPDTAEWTTIKRAGKTFKVPKITFTTDLRNKIASNEAKNQLQPKPSQCQDLKRASCRQQLQQPQQHQSSYAGIAKGGPSPQISLPTFIWELLVLPVYCTKTRFVPMWQQVWSQLQLEVIEAVQN